MTYSRLAIRLGLLLAGSLICPTAHAVVYTVDARESVGSDSNPGTAARPFKTIGRAAGLVKAGDTVRMRTGVYREAVTIAASGTAAAPITFEPDMAAVVVVTGADVVGGLEKASGPAGANLYSTPWEHRFVAWSKTSTHPDDDWHLMIGRAEQVFVSGHPMHQVLDRSQLSRGSFYVDLDAKRLYVWDRANQPLAGGWGPPLVEASARETLWEAEGAYVVTRGIRFRYAANHAQQGAVLLSGDHTTLEDCVVEQTNSIGATFTGRHVVVRSCTFRENGQMGFSAYRAHDLLFTDCLVEGNNTKGFNRGWEAGADKLVLTRRAVLERSRFLRNHGNGVWFDIGNEDCEVRNCLIADNDDAGIFYEISYGLHAHDNVIVGNGLAYNPGGWGANGGIALSSSPRGLIERNLLVGNREGFQFREQGRRTDRIDGKPGEDVAIWNHDSTIRNNAIVRNVDWQVGGWFDIATKDHWPRAMQGSIGGGGGRAGADVAREYVSADSREKPTMLALEDLKLIFSGNVYDMAPGQGFWQWGTSWRDHRRYDTQGQVLAELHLDQQGRVAPVVFADVLTRDFRVPVGSPLIAARCYPRGEVPGVRLGTQGPTRAPRPSAPAAKAH